MSDLYMKDTYLNTEIEYLTNRSIIEYDLKSANTSLCKEYELLPSDEIEKIESLDKKKRVVRIGLLQRKDKSFKEKLSASFIDIRKRFFEANHIEDKQILSIKKDAIFTIGEVEETDFGFCHFVEKNRYTSYLYIKNAFNRFEFYYSSDGKLDIKGLGDEAYALHKEYLISFFKQIFFHMENSSPQTLYRYLSRFATKYKKRELDIGYYREFTQNSIFHLMDHEETYSDSQYIPYEDREKHVDIDYNFSQVIMPLVRMFVF